jgi:hypothetical protein
MRDDSWLEDSHARPNNGDIIWLDCEEEKLTNQPLVEERSEDDCLHVELEELRIRQLRGLEETLGVPTICHLRRGCFGL